MDTLTRERITYEINEDRYVILLDGTPWITQDRTNLPYPDRTLEECCQQQIEDLLTAAAEAAQAQINAEEKLEELYALYATSRPPWSAKFSPSVNLPLALRPGSTSMEEKKSAYIPERASKFFASSSVHQSHMFPFLS